MTANLVVAIADDGTIVRGILIGMDSADRALVKTSREDVVVARRHVASVNQVTKALALAWSKVSVSQWEARIELVSGSDSSAVWSVAIYGDTSASEVIAVQGVFRAVSARQDWRARVTAAIQALAR